MVLRSKRFADSFDEIADAATGLTKGEQALKGLSDEGMAAGNVFKGLWTVVQSHPFASIGTAAAAAALVGYNAWKSYKQSLIQTQLGLLQQISSENTGIFFENCQNSLHL